jgi:uncharacterized CHY-type Zn-finger protein
MTDKDFPGQLITEAGGFTFKHDPGATGGKVYAGHNLRGDFMVIDVGDENTPTGVYVRAWKRSDFLFADTYEGAAACVIAYQYGTEAANRDEAPEEGTPEGDALAKCAEPLCGRERPRWTLDKVRGRLVCSPAYAMSCGRCHPSDSYAVHYTEDEHRHDPMPESHVICGICKGDRPIADMHVYGKAYMCKTHTTDEVDTWVRAQPL